MAQRSSHNKPHGQLPEDTAPPPDYWHYQYAGQKFADAFPVPKDVLAASLEYAQHKGSVHPVVPLGNQRYMIANVTSEEVEAWKTARKLEHDKAEKKQKLTKREHAFIEATDDAFGEHYLFPYYEREAHAYLQQEKRMLASRTQRFFDLAEDGIDIRRTPEEIRAALDHYRQTGEGGPQLVGSMLHRLNDLGSQIVDNRNRRAESTDIVGEFRYYYLLLTSGETAAHYGSKWKALPPVAPEPAINAKQLIGTVRLRNGQPDTDGLLYYFAHETGKVLAVEITSSYDATSDAKHHDSRRNLEMRNREAVTGNVAHACTAIDHVHAAMRRSLIDHPTFKTLTRNAHEITQIEGDPTNPNGAEGLSSTSYGYLIDDLTNKARARACVRLKDSAYFKRIDAEFTEAATRLQTFNSQMRAMPRVTADARDALKLADDGIELICSMARTRMPLDHCAPAFIEDHALGKKKSSVALYETALSRWAERPRSEGMTRGKS